jgi:hypothetical protein
MWWCVNSASIQLQVFKQTKTLKKMQVVIINCLSDNLAYLLIDKSSKKGMITIASRLFAQIHYFLVPVLQLSLLIL